MTSDKTSIIKTHLDYLFERHANRSIVHRLRICLDEITAAKAPSDMVNDLLQLLEERLSQVAGFRLADTHFARYETNMLAEIEASLELRAMAKGSIAETLLPHITSAQFRA